MPKNDNNDNLDNAEATQTPAEYTPEAVAEETEENVTPIAEALSKRRLGTGAIVGISAASVALLAGVFGGGVAVANVIGHGDRGAQVGMNGQGPAQGQMGDGDGDGPHGHGGPKGGMPGGQPGVDSDGSVPGNVPHQHDANGNDIVPDGTATTAPSATTN